MRPIEPRPADRLDLAILGLSVVLGIAAAVAYDLTHGEQFATYRTMAASRPRPDWIMSLQGPARRAMVDLQPFLVVVVLGVGLAVLRRPTLLRGRDWPGPGVAAGVAGSIAVLLGHATIGLAMQSSYLGVPKTLSQFLDTALSHASDSALAAVIGAWALLILVGRWKPRADPVDRVGRYCAYGFLLLYALTVLSPVLWT